MLAALLTAFDHEKIKAQTEGPPADEGASRSEAEADLTLWALRSKGRGFTHILNLEAGLNCATNKSEAPAKPDNPVDGSDTTPKRRSQASITELESKIEASSLTQPDTSRLSDINEMKRYEVEEMLQNLPQGVVAVDLVDVRYGASVRYVAMVYRRGDKVRAVLLSFLT